MNDYKPSALCEIMTELEQIKYCILFLDSALQPMIAESVGDPAACGMMNFFHMLSDRISHSMDRLSRLIFISNESKKKGGEA